MRHGLLLAAATLMAACSLATSGWALDCADAPSPCGCEPVCVAKVEPTKEKKHCWCVTREEVCVPRVRCPWEPGGSPLTCFDWLRRACGQAPACGDGCCDECSPCGCAGADACGCVPCGEVKCVRDLEKKTYEVDACKWTWEIRRLPCPGCGGCDHNGLGGCGCGGAISCGD